MSMAVKRVTIMISNDLDKKVRHIQARRIVKEGKSISYSAALTDLVKKGINK